MFHFPSVRFVQHRPRKPYAGGLPVLVLVLLVLLAGLLAAGCGTDTDGVSEEDRQAIRDLLEGYLPAMAKAYRTGEVEALRPYAVEKELAMLHKRISDLLVQEGRIVASELKSFEIENITIWNYANAFVTTLEVWDLAVLASGSETVLSEVEGQRNRVKYQLKRTDEGWRVIYRERDTTFEE